MTHAYRPTLTYHGHALPDEPVSAWHLRIEDGADAAKAEIRRMAEHARRCLGQRLRRADDALMARLHNEEK